MSKKFRYRDLLYFMYFFWEKAECTECGKPPSFMIDKKPLCLSCVERLYMEEPKEDHAGMTQGYDGVWRWL